MQRPVSLQHIAQDVAVIPEFLDDVRRAHLNYLVFGIHIHACSAWTRVTTFVLVRVQ